MIISVPYLKFSHEFTRPCRVWPHPISLNLSATLPSNNFPAAIKALFLFSNKLIFISEWHLRPLVLAIQKVCDSLPHLLLLALLFIRGRSEPTSPFRRQNTSAFLVKVQPLPSPFAIFSHWFISFTTLFII